MEQPQQTPPRRQPTAPPPAASVVKAPSAAAISSNKVAADYETLHPYTLVLGTSLCGNVLLAPAALALETASMRLYCEERADDPEAILSAFGLSAVGGVLAFLLLVVELRVVALTSALSLSVAGTFKEMLTVIASVLILGEMPTLDKALGLLLCLLGTAVYTRIVHTSGG